MSEGTRTLAAVARPTASRPARRDDRVAADAFRRRTRLALALGATAAAAITLIGLPYYLADPGGRLRNPMHAWLKPSGWVGQSLGIVAFALFAFLWLYPLRKRVRALAVTGSIGRWLDVHIVAGLLVPLFGAVHAGWRFQGIIGLGYACMLTVSLSGIVGRYLYVHLPRGRDGLELSIAEVERRGEALIERIAEALGVDAAAVRAEIAEPAAAAIAPVGALGALAGLVSGDLARWRMTRRLRRRWATAARLDAATVALAVDLARRRAALAQQATMLEATRRLFRYWHVAHLPIAVTGLVAVAVHVAVVVALGVTWFR